ncbi:MAG: hypothetical protein SFY69_06945 [Planctomycetota bacterium]|nr:hypothetical protein [Planctomycetota bacterium]
MRRPPLLLLPLVLAPGACTVGGERSPFAENDRLRREVLALQDRVRTLEGEAREREVKLAEAARAGSILHDARALDALPVCVGVAIDDSSGPLRTPDGRAAVVVGFTPLDGRNRFVQIAGVARVEVLALPAGIETGSAGEPRRIAVESLSPAQLRDAYRTGLLGARYEVELPAPDAPGRVLVLRVEIADALTNRTYRDERIVSPRE